MAKVYSPNKKYDGITAGVQFSNGVGETEDKYILSYLKEKGYIVEDVKQKADNELERLKEEAKALGISFNPNIGKAKLVEKVEEAKKLQIPNNQNTGTDNTVEDEEDEIDVFEDEE